MIHASENTIFLQPRQLRPKLFLIYQGYVNSIDLYGHQAFGRETEKNHPDISVASSVKYVSRAHGEFIVEGTQVYYRDVNDANGTWYKNRKLPKNESVALQNGDVLRVFSETNPSRFVTMIFATDYQEDFTWKSCPLQGIEQLFIGRQPGSSLQLANHEISRQHAVVYKSNGRWTLADYESKNGLFLNGLRLYGPTYLKQGDAFRIANLYFIFVGNFILYQEPVRLSQSKASFTSSMHVDPNNYRRSEALHNTLQIHIEERSVMIKHRKKYLLQNINMSIRSGEMVLILGGSGAGKTTFMNAVMGYEQAKGRIMYGSIDVYAEYASMKSQMGFVPQQDLLRLDDRVIDTLNDAARMKLRKLSADKRQKRIDQVLHTLGLEPEREKLVKKLSGGQRKRLSIAVEYISNPNLFFLDEPDSGLDGIMARTLMENLRSIADEGKTVMVISHGPDRATDLFDKVIVLAKSVRDDCGHLAFFGSVEEAYAFFETDTLEGVVKRINRKDEGGDGLSDEYIDKYAAYERN